MRFIINCILIYMFYPLSSDLCFSVSLSNEDREPFKNFRDELSLTCHARLVYEIDTKSTYYT